MNSSTLGYTAPDYLDRFEAEFDRAAIATLRQERRSQLFDAKVAAYQAAVAATQGLQTDWFNGSGAVVQVGRPEEQPPHLLPALQTFCPWKKGPFNLFGIEIDAEWRSDWKWDRILPEIQPLKGRKVADIGCHNGYFMFRMAHQEPACVIGFEPVAKHFWNFQLIQNWVRQDCLAFELLGVEHIHWYPHFFDTIFCLGILYHHPDPLGLLQKMRQALAPGGELVIDCQGIPGDLPVALTPRKRYAQARGIWFLPTQSCLETWLTRAGFSQVRCFYAAPLSVAEQRCTPWAEVQSLSDFLDPQDASRTVEGYPAPWRYYAIARV